ncbi:MAG: hypothetical protein EXX96DRAFT_571250 [Benjaminiella poitrasii]|nr:MAG: hypothetical protein EXX96DRAFT_571250 [Benjaminiella poitrasii]
MGELTEQEKLERRRLKRQQRILQSGESRLSKITGTAFPNRFTPSPSPSPSTSTAAIKSPSEPKPTSSPSPINTVRQRRPSDDPSDELGAPPTLNSAHGTNNDSSQPMAPNNAMFGEGLFGNGEGSSDPMQQLFAAAMNNANGAGGAGFNPLAALLANQNMDGSSSRAGETPANVEAQRMMDKSAKYWNLLHFIMMVGLGVYAVFTEWKRAGSDRFASLVSNDASMTNYPAIHVPLFWYFVTLELCMQSARLFYQQGKIPTSSNTWLQLATQLPHPFGQIVTIVLRYRLIWSCLVQDICILIFIIGISQVVSSALLSL